MKITDYAAAARTTAIYPGRGQIAGLSYSVLGLVGEAGELANKAKKVLRGDGPLDADCRAAMAKELGDVLWYVVAVADDLGVDLEDVARANLAKLAKRAATGKIKGDGDDREKPATVSDQARHTLALARAAPEIDADAEARLVACVEAAVIAESWGLDKPLTYEGNGLVWATYSEPDAEYEDVIEFGASRGIAGQWRPSVTLRLGGLDYSTWAVPLDEMDDEWQHWVHMSGPSAMCEDITQALAKSSTG